MIVFCMIDLSKDDLTQFIWSEEAALWSDMGLRGSVGNEGEHFVVRLSLEYVMTWLRGVWEAVTMCNGIHGRLLLGL